MIFGSFSEFTHSVSFGNQWDINLVMNWKKLSMFIKYRGLVSIQDSEFKKVVQSLALVVHSLIEREFIQFSSFEEIRNAHIKLIGDHAIFFGQGYNFLCQGQIRSGLEPASPSEISFLSREVAKTGFDYS